MAKKAKKKVAKKKAAKKASGKDVLVVASKIKAAVKAKGLMTSAEAMGAINEAVYALIADAAKRTKANNRKTLKAQDL